MKVQFKTTIEGMKVNEVIGGTAEEIVHELRNRIAKNIPHIPFTKKDDKLREQLDLDGKGDWSDEEFFSTITAYYNVKIRDEDGEFAHVPSDCAGFIGMACKFGMAKIVEA